MTLSPKAAVQPRSTTEVGGALEQQPGPKFTDVVN